MSAQVPLPGARKPVTMGVTEHNPKARHCICFCMPLLKSCIPSSSCLLHRSPGSQGASSRLLPNDGGGCASRSPFAPARLASRARSHFVLLPGLVALPVHASRVHLLQNGGTQSRKAQAEFFHFVQTFVIFFAFVDFETKFR